MWAGLTFTLDFDHCVLIDGRLCEQFVLYVCMEWQAHTGGGGVCLNHQKPECKAILIVQ